MTTPSTSHYERRFFYWYKHYDVISLEIACSGPTVDKITETLHEMLQSARLLYYCITFILGRNY